MLLAAASFRERDGLRVDRDVRGPVRNFFFREREEEVIPLEKKNQFSSETLTFSGLY